MRNALAILVSVVASISAASEDIADQYPQSEFVQDKSELLNNFQVGQQVKISINLRGREWVNPQGETKYFNSIQGWRIEALQQEAGNADMPPVPPTDAFEPITDLNEEDHDDLPF